MKNVEHVAVFRELCRSFVGQRIVELGIAEGGSAVLAALEAKPARLVAVDIEPEPLEALAGFISQRGLTEVVRPDYGVDQADRDRLRSILDAELGQEPIDLLIDDASHDLALTRASFDALFPLVRPGGMYVIEDWAKDHIWQHGIVQAFQAMSPEERAAAFAESGGLGASEPPRPLSDVAIQLVLAQAVASDVVTSVTFTKFHVMVERGPADLDPDTFRLADVAPNYFGHLPAGT